MQIGIYGLGKMGANMARRLARGGVKPALLNRTYQVSAELAQETGGLACQNEQDWLNSLDSPRVAWLMLPAGAATETAIQTLLPMLKPGDILVNGANAYYQEAQRHALLLAERGVLFADAGVSGGIWGLENGYALMVGGEKQTISALEPFLKILAPTPDSGWLHCGPAGSGHFVKMIHNGIEYGMMQAFAEGFDILKGAGQSTIPAARRYDLNLADIAELWRRGSVVSSWLLDLTAIALARDPQLAEFSGHVQDSGEGRWTVEAAIEEAIPAHVLTAALNARFRSRQSPSFADQTLSALRHQFGGHQEPKKG